MDLCKKRKYLTKKVAKKYKKQVEAKIKKKIYIYKCKCGYFHYSSGGYETKKYFRTLQEK